ncbi:glycoside hydrolase family 5 [Halosimplex carlsbadense 2-9-1]|uniref:Glycoside hydrolase family 5 n=1 Tax=Halosimplex carlsbadense 2-9-1 TaxID=797114 RepID=M0D5T2_9EURY|nr:fibronectin type III domain-containing protein [Halosimplex carlsbadense]ELZ30223.1 glycoside hydrolase family 5 [Halosimplex carlsbadense 2-9-1]
MERTEHADGDDGGARDRGTGGTAPVARAAPAGLSVDGTTAVTATLSWSAPASAPTDHYNVYVDGVKRAEADRGRTRVALANLAPATIHSVGVTAVDGAGTESRPATVRLTTDPVDPAADESDADAVEPGPTTAPSHAPEGTGSRRPDSRSPRSGDTGGWTDQGDRATERND